MKTPIDMDLSPAWVGVLRTAGLEAAHWSQVGAPTTSDATLMACARANGQVIVTNDLDFSAILAATRAAPHPRPVVAQWTLAPACHYPAMPLRQPIVARRRARYPAGSRPPVRRDPCRADGGARPG